MLQLAVTDEMRGRVLGIYGYAFVGTAPLGGLLAGWLAEVGGTQLAFLVAGLVAAAATDLRVVRHRPRRARCDAADRSRWRSRTRTTRILPSAGRSIWRYATWSFAGLGQQGLEVSALGLGCMGMSDFYGTAAERDESEAIATIDRAAELGVTMLDTADMYGPFTNEQLIGKALTGRRDQFVVATKFGFVRQADGSQTINGRPEHVHRACDASLQRLDIDVIDLYYQHRLDRSVPIEETVGAMAELVEAGKVRYLGLSEAGPATIRRAQRGVSDLRSAIGILAVRARRRGRRCCRPCASSASASWRTARSAAAS